MRLHRGGTPLWSEQQTVTVDNGVFSVLLGQGSHFQSELRPEPISLVFQGATASDRYVGVTVTPGGELTPRMQLLSSPYAYLASNAITANSATTANSLSGGVVNTSDSGGIVIDNSQLTPVPSGVPPCEAS